MPFQTSPAPFGRESSRSGRERSSRAGERFLPERRRGSLRTCLARREAQANFVRPGMATGGVASVIFQSRGACGASTSLELMASSHVMTCPV
jgi:hypothetical protein